jgi:hypothetical protein
MVCLSMREDGDAGKKISEDGDAGKKISQIDNTLFSYQRPGSAQRITNCGLRHKRWAALKKIPQHRVSGAGTGVEMHS